MATDTAPTYRPGLSDVSQEDTRTHTLIVTVEERPGSVDRVIGALRRRRANMHTLVIGRSEAPSVVRITAVVNDSEVGVDQLVEQLRKIVDVHQADSITDKQSVVRELALIKVNSTAATTQEIIELSQTFGAHAVDVAENSVTLEISGNAEKVDSFIQQLQPYGIHEAARSGRIIMQRGTNATK